MRAFAAIILLSGALLSVNCGQAQSYFTSTELGIALGGAQYFGDLNDNYGFKTVSAAGGIYARKHMNSYISIKLVANYTQVSYNDRYNSSLYERTRNLSFSSPIIEGALQAEFNFFSFVTGDPYHRFTPFLTGGVGIFYYSPSTVYNGTTYSLQPQGTEGQYVGYAGRKYGTTSPCFPIGVGMKFWLKGGINLTLEIADRLTTTDYLDDVSSTYVGASSFPKNSTVAALQDRSIELDPKHPLGIQGKQRGNTASYDQYIMALLSVSWHFTSYKCPSFMKNDELIKATR
jgi:uncharacterized protein DUF6089